MHPRPLSVLTLSLALAWTAAVDAGVIRGRVFGPGNQPLDNLDLDIFDQVTGKKLNTPNDNTASDGSFAVVVPPGLYRVGFDTQDLPGQTLAPHQILGVAVSASTDLGDVLLVPGALVSGRVLGPVGAPVAGADLDLVDATTGQKAFTPGDNTDASGQFSFAVALGSYRVQIEPGAGMNLSVLEVGPFVVDGDVDLGSFLLAAGVPLHGRVLGPGGGPVAGVDTDAFTLAGAPIPLADDPTDGQGRYAVVVPPGVLDLQFDPAPAQPFGTLTIEGVVAAIDTTLDVVLDLSVDDTSGPTAAGLRGSFQGSLAIGPELDVATIEAVAGAQLTLSLRFKPPSALCGLALRTPSGAYLPVETVRKEKPGKLLLKAVPLPESGTYELLHYSRSGAAADYTLRTRPKLPKALRKFSGAGSVALADDVLEVPFTAFAGSLLTAVVKRVGGELEPAVIELRSPTGASVSLDGLMTTVPGMLTRAKEVPLPEDGEYTLRLGGAAATTGELSYLLKVKPPKFPKSTVLED